MAATFVASHQPAVVIPFGAPDYVAHFVNYAVLGALVMRALAGGALGDMTVARILPAVLVCTLYGASDEFHQWFVPGRMVSASDLVADALGSAVGAALSAQVGGLVREMKRRV